MKRLFLSHASEDKPAIRWLAQHLHGLGHEIWVDDPAATGFAPQTERVRGIGIGNDWWASIKQALDGSGVVLWIVTPNSISRRLGVLTAEISYGLSQEVLLPVYLGTGADISRCKQEIEHPYRMIQGLDIDVEADPPGAQHPALGRLVDAIEIMTNNRAEGPQASVHRLLPDLVNRTTAIGAMRSAARVNVRSSAEARANSPVGCAAVGGPMGVVLIHHPKDRLEGLLNRFEHYDGRRVIKDGTSASPGSVKWMKREIATSESQTTDIEAFEDNLGKAIGALYSEFPGADLGADYDPILAITSVGDSHVDKYDALTRAWARAWRRLAKDPMGNHVLPVLSLQYREPRFSFLSGLLGGDTAQRTFEKLKDAADGDTGTRLPFLVTPPLGPVNMKMAEEWRDQWIPEDAVEGAAVDFFVFETFEKTPEVSMRDLYVKINRSEWFKTIDLRRNPVPS